MPNNSVKVRRKTREEVKAYKNFVKQGEMQNIDTIEFSNENLIGSDQCESTDLLSTQKPNISTGYKIKQFIKRMSK